MSDEGGVMSFRHKGRDELKEGSLFTWGGWGIIEGSVVISLITHNEK